MDQDVANALNRMQRQLDDLKSGNGHHALNHELGGQDTIRPQWATGGTASAIGTKLNKQRSTSAGAGLTATEVQGPDPYILLAADSTLFTLGAWTGYTPQVDQGVTTNITKTVTYAHYARIGRTIVGSVRLSMTGAGTAGSNITTTLPVAAVSNSGQPVGLGEYYDASAGQIYAGMAYMVGSASTIAIAADQQSGNNMGVTPNIAVANGDLILFTFCYEAAA